MKNKALTFVSAGFAAVCILLTGCGKEQMSEKDTGSTMELLNVSYDPTREFAPHAGGAYSSFPSDALRSRILRQT